MAANYYRMQEVMDKLQKSEADVQQLVKQGKLRQYMDAGKPVFKVEDVDALAEEIVGLDLTAGGSELDISVDESGEITLEPDDEDKDIKSEGGFGLSQAGDLTSDDTNVGSIGINLLSGTDDAYKLTEDTKAETQAGDLDEIESLDADSNLESFGSGSGLLDLSLQADDTSLGAVLDDILPTGAEGGDIAAEPVADELGLVGEAEELEEKAATQTGRLGGEALAPAGAMAPSSVQMVAVAPEDPASTLFGVMMFFPVLALLVAGIVLTAAVQEVTPSLMKTLIDTTLAEVSLIWFVVGGLAALVLVMWAVTATKGEKKPKAAKEARVKKEKKPKKKKK